MGTSTQQPSGNHLILFFCDSLLYRPGLGSEEVTEESKWTETVETGGRQGTEQAPATSAAF